MPIRFTCLVEIESIQEFVELPVLADFFQLHVVLLKTVERELRLVVDEDFERLYTETLKTSLS